LVAFKNQVKAIRPEQDAQGTMKNFINLLSALIVSQASCLVAFKNQVKAIRPEQDAQGTMVAFKNQVKAIRPEQDAQGTMVVLKNQKQYAPSKMLRVPWARCSEYYDTIINFRLYNSCRRQGKRAGREKFTSLNIWGLNEFF